jgi:hypothetical protein
MNGLARTVAMASRCLLVVPDRAVAGNSLLERMVRSIEVLLHG